MSYLLHDLRLSLRSLRRDMRFAVLSVLFLALGIGANTAVFSVVKGVLVDALPYEDPGRLAVISDRQLEAGGETSRSRMVSPLNFYARKAQSQSFAQMGAMLPRDFVFEGRGEPELLEGAAASSELLPLLGVKMHLGRHFSLEETRDGSETAVALIDYGLWTRRFGADPGVLGQSLTLDGRSFTLIGVLPEEFHSPIGNVEAWIPLKLDPDDPSPFMRRSHMLYTVGRLGNETSLDEARAEMATIDRRLAAEYPDSNTGWSTELSSLEEYHTGDVRPRLLALQLAAGFVLLIVCSNLANLLLLRGERHGREMAIRAALGATRRRMLAQLLMAGLVLAFLGGIAGVLLAWALLENSASFSLLTSLSDSSTAVQTDLFRTIGIDSGVLGFSLVLTLLTGLVFGLVPAIKAFKSNLIDLIRVEGRTAGSLRSHRVLNTLAVCEIALATVLLVGAGLMLKSFRNMNQVDLGFDSRNTLLASFRLPYHSYREPEKKAAFARRLRERIAALPGVTSAGITSTLPLESNLSFRAFNIRGRAPSAEGEALSAHFVLVGPGYFETMGTPLVSGRFFRDSDDAEAPEVVVVSRSFAELHWQGQDPVGQQIQLGPRPTEGSSWRTVIGVVEDMVYEEVTGNAEATFYLPHAQAADLTLAARLNLVARTEAEPRTLIESTRREIWALGPNVPLPKIEPVEEVISDSLAKQQVSTTLIGVFAAAAALLAVLGIYGVVSYFVNQRSREMGIRMALGARPDDLLKRTLGQGLFLTASGLAFGVAGAVLVTRFLASQLYGVQPLDPEVFVGTMAGLLAVVLTACYLPARRASKTDPMTTLRYE